MPFLNHLYAETIKSVHL